MQKITSRENSKLKLARKVRDGRDDDLIFIEGARLADEALRSSLSITDVFIDESFEGSERGAVFLAKCRARDLSVYSLPDKLFAALADTKSSQGVVLTAKRPDSSAASFDRLFEPKNDRPALVVLLHGINNPANLGAILRTAEAVGADGVIISKNSADVFSPKSLRASMGAGFRLNIWTGAEFAAALGWARANDLRSVAADIGAGRAFTAVDWRVPRLVVFGSEAHGLRPDELAAIDEGLVIPMSNEVESLNLAVAAGIVLFEARRAEF